VCEAGACIDGCRGQDGNGCPDGKVCTSPDASVGACQDAGGPTGGTTGGGETDGEAGGCDCRAAPGQGGGSSEGLGLWLVGAVAALALQRRRARGRQFNRSARSIN
jgi:MYXO-CTERM domain-containing protein